MSIEVQWDSNQQSILYVRLAGEWGWSQLHEQMNMLAATARNSLHDVPAILDIRGGLQIPGGNLFLPENLAQLKTLAERGKDRRRPVIVVGGDAQARELYNCLRLLDARFGSRVYFADTLDEARAYLNQNTSLMQKIC